MENDSDIMEIYHKVQQSKTVSPEYMQILHQFNIDREKFDKEITEQQRQENEEYFITGYKRGAKTMVEILSKQQE